MKLETMSSDESSIFYHSQTKSRLIVKVMQFMTLVFFQDLLDPHTIIDSKRN